MSASSVRPSAPNFTGSRPHSKQLDRRAGSMTVTQRFQARPDERDRALFVRIDSTNAGQVHSIAEDAFTFGRHPNNTACIDDQGISRHHAKVSATGLKYWLDDLDSSNGTYVNGRRVNSCELANGDTIQLGPRVSLRFSVASEDEERVLKQLYDSSVRDPLTRVYNRQYFSNQLTNEMSFAIRHQTELALLILDIDFFKKVNDNYGHLAGDDALKQVARVLERELRVEDILARYGGEEFVGLLRGIDVKGAAIAGERLRAAVEREPIVYGDNRLPITISVGGASIRCAGVTDPKNLLELADKRLYAAKESGRNCVVAGEH